MKLLHVDSSILGANSASRSVATAVVDRFRKADPDLEIIYVDLTTAPLPHLTLAQLPSDHPLFAFIPALDVAQQDAARQDRAAGQLALEQFLAADVVIIGAPMYNFTIPSQLKAWIDRILVPGKTFKYGPDGLKGLAGDKRVIVAISRGGVYEPQTLQAAAEHAESYLRTVLSIIGIANPEIIIAEGIRRGPEQRQKAIEAALRAAADLRVA
jgi:FMN-dependent NADH-azoreductase